MLEGLEETGEQRYITYKPVTKKTTQDIQAALRKISQQVSLLLKEWWVEREGGLVRVARSNWAASDLLSLLPLATSLTHSQQNISTTHIRKYRVMVARMSFFFLSPEKKTMDNWKGLGCSFQGKLLRRKKQRSVQLILLEWEHALALCRVKTSDQAPWLQQGRSSAKYTNATEVIWGSGGEKSLLAFSFLQPGQTTVSDYQPCSRPWAVFGGYKKNQK